MTVRTVVKIVSAVNRASRSVLVVVVIERRKPHEKYVKNTTCRRNEETGMLREHNVYFDRLRYVVHGVCDDAFDVPNDHISISFP